jgi:adenine/guanine/hypoxanthine permease
MQFAESSLMPSLDSIVTCLMMMYRIRGAILIGIFLVAIISWPRPTSVTYFPYTPTGDTMFNYFKQVVTFQPLDRTGNQISVGISLCLHSPIPAC